MSAFSDHSDDDIVLAGEYALNLLDGSDRSAFEARLTAEPALRTLLVGWQEHFAALAQEVTSVAPPARVLRQLRQELFPDDGGTFAGLRGWLFGGAVAVALAAAFFILPLFQTSDPAFTAEVAAEDGSIIVAAAIYPPEHIIEVSFSAYTAPEGRVLELWVIDPDQPGPLSLGVLPDGGTARLEVPQAVQDAGLNLANSVLAISDEPPGGSPTGAPTGEVRAIGQINPT